jgi:tetratricopeptide (TPR) repeat protein
VDAAYAGEHREMQRLRARSFLVLEIAPVPDGEEELRRLAATAPDDAVLESRLGFYLAVWGGAERRDEALARLRAAAAREPQRAEIQSNLGWGLSRLGAAEEARAALTAALSLDETRARDRFRLAGILQDAGEREQALELVRSALASRPAADWSDAARSLEGEIVTELGSAGGARS